MAASALEGYGPAVTGFCSQVLQRLSPEQWRLEWSLPLWLAADLGLDRSLGRELALCNLLGLMHVRLQDDLADGDVGEDQRPLAAGLATAALQQALQRYHGLFPADSAFWPDLRQRLAIWVRTISEPVQPVYGLAVTAPAFAHTLAQRGEPLKICVTAACLLAGQVHAIAPLHVALTDALAALVLLDHVQDWRQDLELGRFNAYIAFCSPFVQTPEHIEVNRSQVLERFYLGDGGQPYYLAARGYALAAETAAAQAGCAALADYCAHLAGQIMDYGSGLHERALALLRSLTDEFFSDLPVAAPEH